MRRVAIGDLRIDDAHACIFDAMMASMDPPTTRARPVARCAWVNLANRRSVVYHDREWGVPVRDDRRLFELLVLEGAQAGLTWETILNKRAGYRRAFVGFDPVKVARFGARDVRRLLRDPGIVRHAGKIRAAIGNARALLEARREYGTFTRFVWSFADRAQRRPRTAREVPARTPAGDALSRALKARGFTFVGSTICYAFMQAAGLVNDHTRGCFRARVPRSAGYDRGTPLTEEASHGSEG